MIKQSYTGLLRNDEFALQGERSKLVSVEKAVGIFMEAHGFFAFQSMSIGSRNSRISSQ